MVKIQLQDCSPEHIRRFWVNRSLIRNNPDPWHDVTIPGLDDHQNGTELPRPPYIYLEEEGEYGEPRPTADDRPDGADPDQDIIDRTNDEFEREVAEQLSLDLERPKRSRRKKDPDPDDQEETDRAFGDISDEEQTFWLSTYRVDTAFMQVCHCSDRMSAICGANLERDVSVPILLDERFLLKMLKKHFLTSRQ